MKEFLTSSLLIDSQYIDSDNTLRRSLHRWIAALLFCLALTLDSFVIGIAIAHLAFTGAVDGRSRWSFLGTLLIAAGFPLLLLTAHCMDRIDAAETAIRTEYYCENNLFFDDHV